jgi:hypothetical protein
MVPGATIFVLPNALFAEVRHMNICPVVLQMKQGYISHM